MSIFTDQKKNVLIILLVLLNLFTISMVWFGRNKDGPPRPGKKSFIHLFKKELNLNEDQLKEFERLIDQHRKRVNPIVRKANRKEIIEAITMEVPDTARALMLAREVGEGEELMQTLLIEHYMALRSVCNAAQKEKLRKIFKETVRRPGPKPPPRK